MRQPCKTRPFSFATLVCPYCQDRFVLLRLCWFYQYDLSRIYYSSSWRKLLFSTLFWLPCLQTLFLRTTFVLFARISMTFALPLHFKTYAPSFPKASAKLHLFPDMAKSFRNFFQKILRNRCFLIKSTDLSGSTSQFIALNKTALARRQTSGLTHIIKPKKIMLLRIQRSLAYAGMGWRREY